MSALGIRNRIILTINSRRREVPLRRNSLPTRPAWLFHDGAESQEIKVGRVISIPELQSLYRRIGPGDVAENVRYELGIPLLEREVLPAKVEKEEVGPLRRHIVEYGARHAAEPSP